MPGPLFQGEFKPNDPFTDISDGFGIKANFGGSQGAFSLAISDWNPGPNTNREGTLNSWKLKLCGSIEVTEAGAPVVTSSICDTSLDSESELASDIEVSLALSFSPSVQESIFSGKAPNKVIHFFN